MPMREPYDAISSLEIVLRELVLKIWGDQWLAKSKIDPTTINWQPKREQKQRRGVSIPLDLINYVYFSDLGDMILNNWPDFKEVLLDEEITKVYIKRLKPLRNGVSHARPIMPFERDLISGISGELINLVTKYRSSKGRDMEYYPRITVSRDSFGHDDSNIGTDSGGYQIETRETLIVGQKVEFHCEAVDPADRELTWNLTVDRHGWGAFRNLGTMTGPSIDFEWIVEPQDVGEMTAVGVVMLSSAQYHRGQVWDGRRLFWYTVVPPE